VFVTRHRYALYPSYVLLSHPIRAQVPLGEAQRIEEVTYDPLLNLRWRLAFQELAARDVHASMPLVQGYV
jgi:hypothetical protein